MGFPSWLNKVSGWMKTETAIANAANPTFTEGQSTYLSVDLAGNLRTSGTGGGGGGGEILHQREVDLNAKMDKVNATIAVFKS